MLGLGWKHLIARIRELEQALQAIVDTEDPHGYAVWKAKKALESQDSLKEIGELNGNRPLT